MSVLALIPARAGSKSVPGKNFRVLANGQSPLMLAASVAQAAGCDRIVVSSDARQLGTAYDWIVRPAELAQDDTPMIDVVRHALEQIPGPDDQIVCLLQPTQPLRRPEHVTAAIKLLEDSGADSVVSVVQLPPTHHPDFVLDVVGPERRYSKPYPILWPYVARATRPMRGPQWGEWATVARRQDVASAYIRDGSVYAFRRSTVTEHGNIYGRDVRPLIIDPSETCPLDTPEDWAEAERRLP